MEESTELRYYINPSDLVIWHMDKVNLPALKVGETVEYDTVYKSNIPDLITFKRFLDRFYEYKLVFGSEYPLSWVVYEITAIKDEADWPK